MEKTQPGIVFVREYADNEESAINIRKSTRLQVVNFLAVIPQKGLDALKQLYWYQEIAPYCKNKESCPKPSVQKPIVKIFFYYKIKNQDIPKH